VNVLDLGVLSEVRIALEGFAARLAAERATAADKAATAELIADLEELSATADERLLIDLDQRIHRHVYRCAHNSFLETTLDGYYVLTLRIWFLALDRVNRLGDAVKEHLELLVAIRDGDPARAEDAMKRHVAGFEEAIRRVL
jgi:DNA-binding GntR family transcriptional regulator